MKYVQFTDAQERYPVAILLKEDALRKPELERNYLPPLKQLGVQNSDVIAISLAYEARGKVSAKRVKEYLQDELLPTLKDLKTRYVYCADATYFKALTKQKTEANWGNVLDCVWPGYEDIKVVYGLNYQVLIFDPGKRDKLEIGLKVIVDHVSGRYVPVGEDLLRDVTYVYRDEAAKAKEQLSKLLDKPELTCDIEGFSLSMFDSGIATIGFAWSQHDAVQIQVDYQEMAEPSGGLYGYCETNEPMRDVLRWFFEQYKGQLIYHKANFDVKVLIYQLYMAHDLDKAGMLRGLEIMCRGMQDTKVVAYLALNSTSSPSYSLKDLGQEHAGDWSQGDDIKDIRKIPLDQLMEYNAVDAVTTMYVWNKYYPVMVAEKQDQLYHGLFMESQEMIIHTELVGMPMCPKRLAEVETELTKLRDGYFNTIMQDPMVHRTTLLLREEAMVKKNATLKTIQKTIDDFSHIEFNPGSGPQKALLLHKVIGLPVLDKTPTGQPATGGDELTKLIRHPAGASFKGLLQAMIDLDRVQKILSAFIPAFKAGRLKADGMLYLHGSFNLGGTISGRLSSSDPNMQNLPSGSAYGKLIKSIFMAAKGYLFGGADFAALEDRINALLTRDPNKIKVYTDGYDGHSMRTFAFWPEKCVGIVDTVESINSIQQKYPGLRGDAKAPHFLLQYGGSAAGLVKNVGFSEEEAKKIEENYHKLYDASRQWVASEINKATKQGYVQLAFGLKLRTPLLGNTMLNLKVTPKQAAAESRSAGNAVSGQSWGLLNNRAAVAFRKRVLASKWREEIHIVALIHDAIYVLFPDDPECVAWVNNNLCEEMSWQEDPAIAHDQVKIGANLDLFWPSWAHACTLDYPITVERLQEQCTAHAAALKRKK
ncbi:hypothetical protein [Pseudomonas phage PJNP053]